MPLTVLQLWDNGFGINAAAAGWMALAAVATWLIAFTAYYHALRGARVAVVAPICSTDPLWTALFAWLILGSTFGGLTLAGMAVAMAGVLLVTRWMEAGDAAEAGALAGAAHGDVLPGPAAQAAGAGGSARPPQARLTGRARRRRLGPRAGVHRPRLQRLRQADGDDDAREPGSRHADARRRAIARRKAARDADA